MEAKSIYESLKEEDDRISGGRLFQRMDASTRMNVGRQLLDDIREPCTAADVMKFSIRNLKQKKKRV